MKSILARRMRRLILSNGCVGMWNGNATTPEGNLRTSCESTHNERTSRGLPKGRLHVMRKLRRRDSKLSLVKKISYPMVLGPFSICGWVDVCPMLGANACFGVQTR